MFETAISNGAQKLGLQQEITESSGVNADVAALLVDGAAGGCLSLLSVGSGSGGGLVGGANLLIGVVNEILLVRHVGIDCRGVDDEAVCSARGTDELGASEAGDDAANREEKKESKEKTRQVDKAQSIRQRDIPG